MTTPTTKELRRLADQYETLSRNQVPDYAHDCGLVFQALTMWADELDHLATSGHLTGETPLTDALWARVNGFTDEDGATEAVCELRDHGRRLERILAAKTRGVYEVQIACKAVNNAVDLPTAGG